MVQAIYIFRYYLISHMHSSKEPWIVDKLRLYLFIYRVSVYTTYTVQNISSKRSFNIEDLMRQNKIWSANSWYTVLNVAFLFCSDCLFLQTVSKYWWIFNVELKLVDLKYIPNNSMLCRWTYMLISWHFLCYVGGS